MQLITMTWREACHTVAEAVAVLLDQHRHEEAEAELQGIPAKQSIVFIDPRGDSEAGTHRDFPIAGGAALA